MPPAESSDVALASNAAAWLAAIVDSSDDAIVGKTLDGTIRSWNSGAARLFGYSAEEAIGRSVIMLIPAPLRAEEAMILSRLSRGERVEHYETRRLRKDGTEFEVSLSVSPIRDAQGAIVGAAKIARDISEARRLQRVERELNEELQEQAAELEQQVEEGQALQEELEHTMDELRRSADEAELAQRAAEEANSAKSQFLTTMSHELRTPLNAIAGYVELLAMGLRGPVTDAQRADLDRIKMNEEMLLRLIDDVLSFAKLESGRLDYNVTDTQLDQLLERLESFVAPRLAKKGIDYVFEPCDANLRVRADRDKTEQIMVNLLSNAAKFTDKGRITVQCVPTAIGVEIAVRDTGRGIPAELLESIFEPFTQGERDLTRTAEGTGLGLSISRQLARAMGGDVLVQSEVGKGSTFTLVLPMPQSTR
jgi:PAS domain S-box-containing protein